MHSNRYWTQPCKDEPSCGCKVCFFAHSPQQLWVLTQQSGRESGSKFLSLPTSILVSPPVSPNHHICRQLKVYLAGLDQGTRWVNSLLLCERWKWVVRGIKWGHFCHLGLGRPVCRLFDTGSIARLWLRLEMWLEVLIMEAMRSWRGENNGKNLEQVLWKTDWWLGSLMILAWVNDRGFSLRLVAMVLWTPGGGSCWLVWIHLWWVWWFFSVGGFRVRWFFWVGFLVWDWWFFHVGVFGGE